jgi:ferric-dicitrate binding protein FerR (iron transport regulator)
MNITQADPPADIESQAAAWYAEVTSHELVAQRWQDFKRWFQTNAACRTAFLRVAEAHAKTGDRND